MNTLAVETLFKETDSCCASTLERIKALIDHKDIRIHERDVKIEQLERTIEKLLGDLDKDADVISRLLHVSKTEIGELRRTNEELTRTCEKMKEKEIELDVKLQNSYENYNNIGCDLIEMSEENKDCREKIEELKRRNEELSRTCEKLKEREIELDVMLQNSYENYNNIGYDLIKLWKENAKLREKGVECDLELKSAPSPPLLPEELSSANSRIKELEDQLSEADEKLRTATETLESQRVSFEDLQKKYDALENLQIESRTDKKSVDCGEDTEPGIYLKSSVAKNIHEVLQYCCGEPLIHCGPFSRLLNALFKFLLTNQKGMDTDKMNHFATIFERVHTAFLNSPPEFVGGCYQRLHKALNIAETLLKTLEE